MEKAYNSLQNAIALSEIDNGSIATWNEKELNATDFWNIYLKPYFKNAKLCSSLQSCSGYDGVDYRNWHIGDWNVITAGDRLLFQLQDGTVIFWLKDVETLNQTHTVIMIDANGARGPNKKGYDVFLFVKDYNKNKIIAEKGDCQASARYCAYEIMSNSWKFPKNYPYKI